MGLIVLFRYPPFGLSPNVTSLGLRAAWDLPRPCGSWGVKMGKDSNGLVTVRIPVRIDFAGGWSDVHYFSAREGGAVLNAAISPYVEGSARWEGKQLHLEYNLALPPGSHLGTSASVDVAWLALTNGLIGRKQSSVELAGAAYHLEELLG